MFENKKDALKYIVKVKYTETGAKGSAVLLPINNENYSYILTAKHTFGKDDNERDKEYYNIKISNIDEKKIELTNPENHIFEVVEVLDLNIDSKIDIVVIKIKKDKYFTEELSLSIYNEEDFHKENLLAYGYPSLTKDGYVDYHDFECEHSPIAKSINFKAKLVDYTNIDESKDTQDDMQGLSGAGIFVEKNNKVFLVGLITDSSHGNYMVSIELRKILDEINKELNIPLPIVESQEKKYSDIKQILKEQYNDVDEFKKAILEYYPSDSDNFDKIKKINTIDELFLVLFEEKWCLYCLLEALEKPHNLEEFSDTDCSKKREQALKTRIVKTIILKFKENESRDGYTIHGWLKHDSGSYRNMSVLNNIKFDNDEYKLKLSEYLAIELKGKNYPTPLQLELILPIELFTVEFKTLKIKLNSIIPQEKEFNRVFDISTKFLINIENYYNSELIRNWQENSKCYRDNLEEMIENRFLFHIEDISKKEILDGYNNNNKISILSNYSLLNSTDLVEMINYGLPFTLCPQNKEYDVIDKICFNNKLVRGMKQIIFTFIRVERTEISLHYIHDNYYDYDKEFLNSFYKSVEYQETDDDNYLE